MPIAVPNKGAISMTSQISLDVPLAADGGLVHLWQTLDATCESESGATAQGYSDLSASSTDIVTFATTHEVGSGDHVVRTCATAFQLVGTDTTNVSDSHISVVWSPGAVEVSSAAASGLARQDVAQLAAEVQERVNELRSR